MGIQVEFNPDLALRAYETPGRAKSECIPKCLEAGKVYEFLKSGQRNYWLDGEIPLMITKGNGQLERPIASIRILEYTCKILEDSKHYTKGKYQVIEVFDPEDPKINFESYKRI